MMKRLKVQQNFDASPCLIVYLGALILSCTALGAHSVVVIVMIATGSTETLNTQDIFWTGLFSGSLIPAAPIGVFFLTLDRIFIIALPAVYSKKTTKIAIALCSLFTICALFTMNLTINVIERPTKQVLGCYSFGCITSAGSRFIYAVDRLGVALPNFTSGVVFVVVLFTFRRKLQASSYGAKNHSKRTGDRLALYVVLFEVFLDLLPNMFNFFLTTVYKINISQYVGAFRSFTFSTNAICCVLAHTSVLRRMFGASNELRRARQTQLAHGALSVAVTRPRQAHADQSEIINQHFVHRMVSVRVKSYFINRFSLIRKEQKTPVIYVRRCYSFGCITSAGSRFIYAVDRLGVALPNFTSGVVFVVVLFTFRRKLQASSYGAKNHSKRTGDRLALYVVLFEVFLDLLPNMFNFFLTTVYKINISQYVGAFRSDCIPVILATNAICCVLAHTSVLRRMFGASNELRRARQTQLAHGALSVAVTRPRQAHADQSEIINQHFVHRMVSVRVKSYFINRFSLIRKEQKTPVIYVRSKSSPK